jgi:nucleotide-binding universal stress UspA family protein
LFAKIMKTIKKILVAIGDESSLNRCLNVAIPLAKGLDASITGIHILAPYPRSFLSALEQPWRKQQKENADKYLEIAKKKCEEHGIAFHKIVSRGQPREAILEHEKEFDLLVIGRADWGSKLLGSVSNGVVTKTTKEVLLVR